jgi:hypothetical protein
MLSAAEGGAAGEPSGGVEAPLPLRDFSLLYQSLSALYLQMHHYPQWYSIPDVRTSGKFGAANPALWSL